MKNIDIKEYKLYDSKNRNFQRKRRQNKTIIFRDELNGHNLTHTPTYTCVCFIKLFFKDSIFDFKWYAQTSDSFSSHAAFSVFI